MDTSELKTCVECGKEKALSGFRLGRNKCRACNKLLEQKNKSEYSREKSKLYHKKYQADNYDEIRNRRAEFYKNNSNELKIKSKLYAKNNRKKRNALAARRENQLSKQLASSYIIRLIHSRLKLPFHIIRQHPEFILNYTEQIKIKRLLKSLTTQSNENGKSSQAAQ